MDHDDGKGLVPVRFSYSRRQALIGLVAIATTVRFLSAARAATKEDDEIFLQTSRTITGTDSLSADVAQRIHQLLSERTEVPRPLIRMEMPDERYVSRSLSDSSGFFRLRHEFQTLWS